MIGAGANVLFSQADDEAYRQELISDGLAALPTDYTDELVTHLGIPVDFFENTLLPEIIATPTADGDFLADIDIYISVLTDLEPSLTTTFDEIDAIVPEPSTVLLLGAGLAAMGAVCRRRRGR